MALMDMSLSKLLETVKDREAWHAAVLWVTKSQTGLGTEQQENMPTSMDNLAVPNVTQKIIQIQFNFNEQHIENEIVCSNNSL